jgi:hypothetical protein
MGWPAIESEIEPDWRISRIRLSDKTSRLRPRLAAPTRGQAYETVMPVEVREWIRPAPASPDLVLGRANSEVLKPYWNGDDITARRDRWIIDLPLGISEFEASQFEVPFEYLRHVDYSPENATPKGSFVQYRKTTPGQNPSWWEPHRPRPKMQRLIKSPRRYFVTPETSEHRLFIWREYPILPDKNLIVFPREDDASFGLLHSRIHELWSTAQGNRIGQGNQRRYNNTTVFETFPFPEGLTPDQPAAEYAGDPPAVAIAEAARRLNELRVAWLNPSDLVERIPEVVPGFPDRIVPISPKAGAIRKKRTLTNLYNERPAWLDNTHRDLDAAVAAAYGWPADISEEGALARLLELNRERAAADR